MMEANEMIIEDLLAKRGMTKYRLAREDLSRVDFANRNTSFLGLFRRISSTEDYTEKG
jgi:hypothetical protein